MNRLSSSHIDDKPSRSGHQTNKLEAHQTNKLKAQRKEKEEKRARAGEYLVGRQAVWRGDGSPLIRGYGGGASASPGVRRPTAS
jgi:hypothetical protein